MEATAVPWPGQAHHRLAQAIGYANAALDAVTPRLLSRPTPCRGWNLRMLLEHAEESVVALHEGVTVSRIAMTPVQAPATADGVASAASLVGAVREWTAALLHASAQAAGAATVSIGDRPMPLDCLRTAGAVEIAVHAWDISQACGQCLPVPDDLAADLLDQALLMVPLLDRAPQFAAPVPVVPGASSGDRLTAYLGRPVRPAS